MPLTATKPHPLLINRLPQLQKEAEQLEQVVSELKTKHQQLTQLFVLDEN